MTLEDVEPGIVGPDSGGTLGSIGESYSSPDLGLISVVPTGACYQDDHRPDPQEQ